jgi:hypothetical protein
VLKTEILKKSFFYSFAVEFVLSAICLYICLPNNWHSGLTVFLFVHMPSSFLGYGLGQLFSAESGDIAVVLMVVVSIFLQLIFFTVVFRAFLKTNKLPPTT